jgi:antitoxin PrlF
MPSLPIRDTRLAANALDRGSETRYCMIYNQIIQKIQNIQEEREEMASKAEKEACCSSGEDTESICRVESLISVDERGQMVLPKDFRDRAGIKPGDKLALISWTRNGEVCCMSLMKADGLVEIVKDRLGPIMAEML